MVTVTMKDKGFQKKALTKLDIVGLKCKDITVGTKVNIVKAMVSLVVTMAVKDESSGRQNEEKQMLLN